MAEDIKSLTKKCADLEKRLKFAEAKIKIVADSMTSSKDMEKYLDVLQTKLEKDLDAGIKVSEKTHQRAMDLSEKAIETYNKEREKEYQQENKKYLKEMEKMNRESVRKAELIVVQARLSTLEALVAGLSRR